MKSIFAHISEKWSYNLELQDLLMRLVVLVFCSDMLGNATTQIHLMQRQDSEKSCWVSVIAHLWNESFQVLSVATLFPSIFLSKHSSIFKIVLIMKVLQTATTTKRRYMCAKGEEQLVLFPTLKREKCLQMQENLAQFFF